MRWLKSKKYLWISLVCFFFCVVFCAIAIQSRRSMLLVLYNSENVTARDKLAIEEYCEGFNSKLIDVKDYCTAPEIYQMLKGNYSHFFDTIKGIQIFGVVADVPAFDCKFKCEMQDGEIDTWWGRFKSDFCYSNFVAEADDLEGPIQIYDIMKSKTNFDFIPHWQVARVPLTKGQFSKFVEKNSIFHEQNPGNMLPLSVFSCTVLDADKDPRNPDDICHFVKDRLDKEFSFLSGMKYSLYGNQFGEFPIKDATDGAFSKQNVVKENKKGVRDFFISTHGFKDQIVQSIKWAYEEKNHLYEFIGIKNVNKKMKYNYYTLTAWCCHLARDMDTNNFVHKAMKGKCVDAIAATNILSNNGSQNDSNLKDMEVNNPFFYHYHFFKNLAQGYSRSKSFSRAKASYAAAVLAHQDEYNYQYNLHNILALHYFGLIQ